MVAEKQEVEKENVFKKLMANPFITFFLGLLLMYILLEAPWILIAVGAVTAICLYAFRDKIDFNALLGKKIIKNKEGKHAPVEACDECGSLGFKHKKHCSHYGEKTKKEQKT
jgi:hypothetical protein